jgi:ribonuclease HI
MELTIFCDGGSRGNPGQAAVGGVVISEGKTIKKLSKAIGIATNNEAEYIAVIHSLEWLSQQQLKTKSESLKLNFKLDSKLVANQLAGEFKIKQPHLKDLALKVFSLINKSKASATFTYIPRENNSQADALVNLALDSL